MLLLSSILVLSSAVSPKQRRLTKESPDAAASTRENSKVPDVQETSKGVDGDATHSP